MRKLAFLMILVGFGFMSYGAYLPSTETILTDEYGFEAEYSPMGEVRTVDPTRLVGSTFEGTTIDTNFWAAVTAVSGTVTQGNTELVLSTGVTANGTAAVTSVRKSRYVGGSCNRYRAVIRLGDSGATSNVRKWGMFDGTNGCYFKLEGTTLYACVLKGSTEDAVASTSWNGTSVSVTLTNANTYEIYVTNTKVYFVLGSTLVHTYTATSTPWTATMALPCMISNANTGGVSTNHTITARVMTIYRLGRRDTQSTAGRVTGAATYVFKRGPGMLKHITLGVPTGTLLTIIDGVAAGGTTITTIATPAQANPVWLNYDVPFSTGLCVISTGTWDATVVYE